MLTARRPRLAARPASLVAVALLLAGMTGCSGDSGGGSTGRDDASSGTPSDATTSAVEEGTTPPGTELRVGASAWVRFSPTPTVSSLLRLAVRGIDKGRIGDLDEFDLGPAARRSNVYYVTARVKKLSGDDVGGRPLALYGKVSDDLVVPPVQFESPFSRCNTAPLPKPFREGSATRLCFVFLAPRHGRVSEVQWRPADNAEPITWAAR